MASSSKYAADSEAQRQRKSLVRRRARRLYKAEMGGDEGPDRQGVGTLLLLPGLRHRLVAFLGIEGGLLPITSHTLDAGQVVDDVRHRVLVSVGQSISAERLECSSRVVELPSPLEQQRVDPARTAEHRAPPELAFERKGPLDRRERDSASAS